MTVQEMIIIKLNELRDLLDEQGNEKYPSFIDALRYYFINLAYGIDVGMPVIDKENNQIRLVQDVLLHYDTDDYSTLLADIRTIDCNGKTYTDTVSKLSDRFYTIDTSHYFMENDFLWQQLNYKGANNNDK